MDSGFTGARLKPGMADSRSASAIGSTRLPAPRAASPFRYSRFEPGSLVNQSTNPSPRPSIPGFRISNARQADSTRKPLGKCGQASSRRKTAYTCGMTEEGPHNWGHSGDWVVPRAKSKASPPANSLFHHLRQILHRQPYMPCHFGAGEREAALLEQAIAHGQAASLEDRVQVFPRGGCFVASIER